MKIILSILLSFLITGLTMGCSPVHEGAVTDDSSLNSVQSLESFEETLYPVLRNRCASCHGKNQQPLLAVPDSQQSMETLIDSELVNLQKPSQSKIVKKIKSGHQGFSVSVANDIEVAILAWTASMNNSNDAE